MEISQCNQVCYWFDSTLLVEPVESVFDIDFWQQRDKVIGSAQGRGTTWFVATEQMPAALRHYRRGGLFGKLVADQYWFTQWEQTRSYLEFELLTRLRQADVNVPRPIAARAVKSGLIYRADLLSEKIANAKDLVTVISQQTLPLDIYQKIGAEIAKMHQVQVNHTDLNIHNILIDDQQRVWIIDFDKCYQQAGEDWKRDNLQRLQRSFYKERERCGAQFGEEDLRILFAAAGCQDL